MPDRHEQFDVTPRLRELFETKQRDRLAAREYYQNLLYNPHRSPSEVPFDPQLQRFSAMSAYHAHFFKPSGRDLSFFFVCLSPFAICFFALKHYKEKQEALLRSGKVKYSDRDFKYIY